VPAAVSASAAVRRLFDEGASIVAAGVRKEEVDKIVSEFGAAAGFMVSALTLRTPTR
jgi:hypothetical protein